MVEESPSTTPAYQLSSHPASSRLLHIPSGDFHSIEDTSPQALSSAPKSLTIENATRIPVALAGAFSKFEKSKRPFSYFPGGQLPDLSNPQPSSVRRSQTPTARTPISALSSPTYEPPTPTPAMPTVQHLQYNSPAALYSNPNVAEAYGQQVPGGLQSGPGKKMNIADSATYQLIQAEQEGAPLPQEHSAKLEEPAKERSHVPDWHGYINPNQQSPSFKRLQAATPGIDYSEGEGAENDYGRRRAKSSDPDRFLGVDRQDINPSPTFHNIQRQTGDYSFLGSSHAPAQAQTFSPVSPRGGEPQGENLGSVIPSSVFGNLSSQTTQHTQQQQSWVGSAQFQEQAAPQPSLDPVFAQRVAEAEAPKVPESEKPSWANVAEQKQQTWSQVTSETGRPSYPTGADVKPNWRDAGLNHAGDVVMDFQPKKYAAGAEVRPSWEVHAERKHQKWTSRQGAAEPQPQQFPAGEQVQADWSNAAQRREDKWSSHYSHYNIDQGQSGQAITAGHGGDPYRFRTPDPVQQSPRPRAKSQEPGGWRNQTQYKRVVTTTDSGKKEWMKPYIAPNLRSLNPGQGTGSVVSIHRIEGGGGPQATHGTGFGTYYGGSPGFSSGHRQTQSSSNYNLNSQQWVGSGYEAKSDVGGTSYNMSNVAPSWQRTSDYLSKSQTLTQSAAPVPVPAPASPAVQETQFPGTAQLRSQFEGQSRGENLGSVIPASTFSNLSSKTTTQTNQYQQQSQQQHRSVSGSYSHEHEAWKQRQIMEEDLRQRQLNKSNTSNQQVTTTQTGSGGPVVKTYTTVTTGDQPKSQWQSAAGATTKAATAGEYLDKDGHKVSYTKEMYTSSDPGREFSMLTQEEKKIMEEPVEPGIISRHTTTKYYKKSTFTNSTTTSTTENPKKITAGPPPTNAPPSALQWRKQPHTDGGVSDF